jgi:hypothetical protein
MLIRDLSGCWLERLKNRKRKPLKPASLAIFTSYVSNHVNPIIGDLEVESFQSKQMKEFAEALVAKNLAPKTIHELVNTVQQIISSAHSSGNDITTRYDKSTDDKEWRQTWAKRCGIGFELPEISKPGDPRPHTRRTPAKPAALATATSPYVASDDDLPVELFESPIEMLADAK